MLKENEIGKIKTLAKPRPINKKKIHFYFVVGIVLIIIISVSAIWSTNRTKKIRLEEMDAQQTEIQKEKAEKQATEKELESTKSVFVYREGQINPQAATDELWKRLEEKSEQEKLQKEQVPIEESNKTEVPPTEPAQKSIVDTVDRAPRLIERISVVADDAPMPTPAPREIRISSSGISTRDYREATARRGTPVTQGNPYQVADQEIDQIQERKKEVFPTLIYNDYPEVRLTEGDIIDGVLQNQVVCDSEEHPLIVAVSKDFYDSDNRWIVIPIGTRVIGYSKTMATESDNRLFVWFKRMVLPNGSSVDFPENRRGMALEKTGSLGIKGSVNRHVWRQISTAVLFGLFDGLAGLTQTKLSESEQLSMMIARTGNNMNEVNRNIFQVRNKVIPTITIPAGKKVKIYLSCDLILSPWGPVRSQYLRESK